MIDYIVLGLNILVLIVVVIVWVISHKERHEGARDRRTILDEVRLSLKEQRLTLELVRSLVVVDKSHKERAIEATEKVSNALPAMARQTDVMIESIHQVPEKVVEKMLDSGPGSGVNKSPGP